jgi:hypothetical protein
VEALALRTVVLDDDARASNDLAGVTLLVNLAKTSPGTEDLGVLDLQHSLDPAFISKRPRDIDEP